MDDVKIYTVKELAALLRVHYQTALDYCETGKIRAKKLGKGKGWRWIITSDAVREFTTPAPAPQG